MLASKIAGLVNNCVWQTLTSICYAVRIIETQHRWEKPGITNPGFEVDPTASILEEKFNMRGKVGGRA